MYLGITCNKFHSDRCTSSCHMKSAGFDILVCMHECTTWLNLNYSPDRFSTEIVFMCVHRRNSLYQCYLYQWWPVSSSQNKNIVCDKHSALFFLLHSTVSKTRTLIRFSDISTWICFLVKESTDTLPASGYR